VTWGDLRRRGGSSQVAPVGGPWSHAEVKDEESGHAVAAAGHAVASADEQEESRRVVYDMIDIASAWRCNEAIRDLLPLVTRAVAAAEQAP